jgi:hypothetical protein
LDGVEPSGLKPAAKRAVIDLSKRLKPASVNDYIRALNAFARWAQ